ncbi:hypothetical protein IWW34DRAFT_808112 [Fusarium oxysporum f. sp. albedinis]|nr:hypothetical protein IWW34DRAFT_808112 [Fusarium oxysporum f. sp. albedinis]
MSRTNTFYSLGVMPGLMGLGHLAPAIGAIQTATGSYHFPVRLLGLIAMDTYKDLSPSNRPAKWIWNLWVYGLWAIVLACTATLDLHTIYDIYRVLPLGLAWGIPCVPLYSISKGWILSKPKTLLFEAKSLVVAFCMASVCAEASMAYCCRQKEYQCASRDLRARSFYLAVLYQFFRETSCDIRDIPEDTKEGLKTLPVKLGKQNTVLLLATVGVLAESLLTHGIDITTSGINVKAPLIARAFLRVGLTMTSYWQVLRFPRQNSWAWGSMSLLGLAPVLFAQAALRD